MGMQVENTFVCKKDTPFWDSSRTIDERLDWLMGAMTLDEKLQCMSGRVPDLYRLGIPGNCVGGEAAHGVEARNDQNKLGDPDKTTSFVQPIGMSATWDPEILKKAGAVTGTEARILYHKRPWGGLSRWAPTVDLERDPRWGRNEEGYGEDPVLTGEMASAYIRGMQGDHPKYLRIAATLKHFYANNTERGRIWKSVTVDPRNKYELYLEPFRRCIEKGKAEAIMTAYNRINGTTGMLNPEVKNILKKQYGLHHAVCDGGAMVLVANVQHYFGSHAETIAASVKAGVDSMSDNPAVVAKAAREAYDLGLLTMEDIDGAIRNMFATKIRLGIYDAIPANPYDLVKDCEMISEKHDAVCRQVSKEAVVLLKNDGNTLPLSEKTDVSKLALIGPFADRWYQDWYGGEPAYRTTLKQGVEKLTEHEISFSEGYSRVMLKIGEKGLSVSEDGRLKLSDKPDVFLYQDWGEERVTLQSEKNGLYMNIRRVEEDPESDKFIYVEKTAPFDWFVLEIFHFNKKADGSLQMTTRFEQAIDIDEEGYVYACEGEGASVNVVELSDGIKEAVELASQKEQVILALGCNSMVNAKEEIDRETLCLPPHQQKLMEAVYAANQNVVLVLFSNYPYTIGWAKEHIPAIVWSATGAQDMGLAMAETLFGVNAPAGRLNMTWPVSVEDLPDIDDYDIIGKGRTYRYTTAPVLFAFGHGLTYTDFTYSDLTVKVADLATLKVSVKVQNTGNRVSDEVVQIYAKAPSSRVKKPISQLIAFKREKEIAPGEIRTVDFEISTDELRFYDVISKTFMVEEGVYKIYAAPSSDRLTLAEEVFVPGSKTGTRTFTERIAADHYDTYENIELREGKHGFCAACPVDEAQKARLVYGDFEYHGEKGNGLFYMRSHTECKIEVYLNGKLAGSYAGNTFDYDKTPQFYPDQKSREEGRIRTKLQDPIFTEVMIPLDVNGLNENERVQVELVLSGDIELCYFRLED